MNGNTYVTKQELFDVVNAVLDMHYANNVDGLYSIFYNLKDELSSNESEETPTND